MTEQTSTPQAALEAKVPLKTLRKSHCRHQRQRWRRKNIVSANLAAALAKRGQRVLVLDADLGIGPISTSC